MDIDGIWTFLLEREGLETADRIVDELFRSFSALAEVPGKGHRRTDLTERDVRFHRIYSYLIIFVPNSKPLQILGVLHERRNVARLLRKRR